MARMKKEDGSFEPTTNVGLPPIQSIGNMNAPVQQGGFDGVTADEEGKSKVRFPRIVASKKGWVKMTPEDVIEYQKNGLLIGYDPANGMGLLKKD